MPEANRRPDQEGDQRPEDDALLEGAVQEGGVVFEQADEERAESRERIADQPADDRADESAQPDDEAGIVIERRRRADQDAGDAGERRGDQEGERAGRRRPDADEAGADAGYRRLPPRPARHGAAQVEG